MEKSIEKKMRTLSLIIQGLVHTPCLCLKRIGSQTVVWRGDLLSVRTDVH